MPLLIFFSAPSYAGKLHIATMCTYVFNNYYWNIYFSFCSPSLRHPVYD